MAEVPPEVVEAATHAVRAHEWSTGPWSAHARHSYDAECAVCQGDVEAILAVAAPILAGAGRRTRARIVCPVCTQTVVRRDDGRPIRHFPPPGREDLACDTHGRGHCRGGCRCRKHRDA